MRPNLPPATDASFLRKLEELRIKIDQLPAEHRPHLYALADVIATQHKQMHTKSRDSNEPIQL